MEKLDLVDIERLPRRLQASSAAHDRRDAAEQLGNMATSSVRIVRALIAASESDSYSMVNRAAAKSLRSRVHQEILQEHPNLMRRAQSATEQIVAVPEREQAGTRARESEVPVVRQAIEAKRAASAMHTASLPGTSSYWLWGLGYLLVFSATALLQGLGAYELWVAGVVWLLGGVLAVYILIKKGFKLTGEPVRLYYPDLLYGGLTAWFVCALACLAALGPLYLLVALLVRRRDSASRDAG